MEKALFDPGIFLKPAGILHKISNPGFSVVFLDNCSPTVTIVLVVSTNGGTCPGNFTLARAWTATDPCGNSVQATQLVWVTDTTAPSLSSLVTRDTDGDGFIDRLALGFDENVGESTIVAGNFAVSAGSISSVVDDGTAGNPVIWVNLTDGVLASNAAPTLTIAAGGIQDLPGNLNTLISAFPSSDGAGPAIWSAVGSDQTNILAGSASRPLPQPARRMARRAGTRKTARLTAADVTGMRDSSPC